jgi:hypothetical protein
VDRSFHREAATVDTMHEDTISLVDLFFAFVGFIGVLTTIGTFFGDRGRARYSGNEIGPLGRRQWGTLPSLQGGSIWLAGAEANIPNPDWLALKRFYYHVA